MGGDLHTENSRKLTDKEEAYIIANPDLYIKRIHREDLNDPNPKAKRYKPYKLEDLPPEKHREAGYCDEPGLHYVPLDIYPKRTHILRFNEEDILFNPHELPETKRRPYDTPSSEQMKIEYLETLRHYGFIEFYENFPRKNVDISVLYEFYGPHTTVGKSLQKKILESKAKERKPIKSL